MSNRMKKTIRQTWVLGFSALAVAALITAPGAALAKGGKEFRLRVNMVNTGAVPKAKGNAEFRERVDRMDFKVRVQNLAPGNYDVLVADVFEGNLVVNGARKGEAEFRTNPEPGENKIPMDFDPRGQVIDVAQGATIFLSVVMPQGSLADALNKKNKGKKGKKSNNAKIEIEVAMTPTGALLGADGKIRFRSRKGRDDVRAEIEDVPDGSYTLRVAGTDVGTLVVTLGEGELEFDTQAKNGKLPLTFDPRGQLVEVHQNGTVILQVVFPQS